MEILQVLYFALALLSVAGCIALVLNQLHVIEKAEEQEWIHEIQERIEAIR